MTTRLKALAALALAAGTAAASAQMSPADPSHEDMHRMMEAMHGEGASERMHEAMGEDAEQLMDQCASMMVMVAGMGGGTMPGGMGDMMGTPGR